MELRLLLSSTPDNPVQREVDTSGMHLYYATGCRLLWYTRTLQGHADRYKKKKQSTARSSCPEEVGTGIYVHRHETKHDNLDHFLSKKFLPEVVPMAVTKMAARAAKERIVITSVVKVCSDTYEG